MSEQIYHPQNLTFGQRLKWLFDSETLRLFVALVRADYRLNDHNSILGVFWSLLNPLVMLAVMYFLFRDRFGQDIDGYPIYLLIGIIVINSFSTTTKLVMKTFLNNKIAFRNVLMPREIFIMAQITPLMNKFGLELIFCFLAAFISGFLHWQALLLIWPLLLAFYSLVISTCLILALVYSVVRDLEHLWNLAMWLILLVSPVFYSLDSLSPRAATIVFWLNPLTPFLIAFRGVIMGDESFEPWIYLYAVALGILAILPAYTLFIRYESRAMERA